MKLRTHLIAFLFSGLLAVMTAMPLQAATYDGAWIATDVNIFVVDFDFGSKGFFFLYDQSGDGPTDNLNVFAENPMAADVYFTRDSGNLLHVSLTAADTSSSSRILTGDSFGFFFSDAIDGSNPILVYDRQPLGTTTGSSVSYRLTSSSLGMSVLVHDVAPVPLPAAFWLLGSGLAAIVGVKKRMRV